MLTRLRFYLGVGLGVSLAVSLLFNYSQSLLNQNLSTSLSASQQFVESLTAKNHALANQVQGLVQARDAAQLAAADMEASLAEALFSSVVRYRSAQP